MAEAISREDISPAIPRSGPRAVSEDLIRSLTVISDIVIILGTGSLAYAAWLSTSRDVRWQDYAVVMSFGTLIALNIFHLSGTYKFTSLIHPASSLRRVTLGWIGVTVILIAAGFLAKYSDAYSRVWSLSWFLSAWTMLAMSRIVLYVLSRRWIADGRLSRSVAIVGTGPIARRLVQYFNEHAESGVRVVGIFGDGHERASNHPAGPRNRTPVLGDLTALERFVRAGPVDAVIIAVSPEDEDRLLDITAKLKTLPVDVRLCAGAAAFHLNQPGVTYFGHLPLLNVIDKPLSGWRMVVKSIEDLAISAFILLLISPLMLAIALAVRIDSPGPIFFRQRRYGFNNQLIEILKFRTMYHDQRDEDAARLTRRGDARVTPVGAFLRKYSLDELPQFINVIRGEMSIVGPRPHALSAKAAGRLYNDAVQDYASRHRVKPGITGWAQINGWRGETETLEQIEKRVEHDLAYIESWSLWLDIKIILLTIIRGFTDEHAY